MRNSEKHKRRQEILNQEWASHLTLINVSSFVSVKLKQKKKKGKKGKKLSLINNGPTRVT